MRPPALIRASVVIAVIASCGKHSEPCTVPTGCVRGGDVAGACQCQEWEIVSIEPVPMKYMVVGVTYALVGSLTRYSYGSPAFFGPTVAPDGFPNADSILGIRWRAVIRSADGSEQVAALGPNNVGVGDFGPFIPITMSSAAVVMEGMRSGGSGYDAPLHQIDQIFVWLDPGPSWSPTTRVQRRSPGRLRVRTEGCTSGTSMRPSSRPYPRELAGTPRRCSRVWIRKTSRRS